MKYTNRSVMGLMLDVSFWIHQERSIKYDMKVLFFQLKQNGTSGGLLNLLCDFLRNRKQRIVLNRPASMWTNVNPGFP